MMSTTRSTSWGGWVGFAGIILLLNGIFSLFQALVALLTPAGYYNTTGAGLFLMSVNGYGWWNLVVGLLLIAIAGGLVAGAPWARIIAVILAALSAVGQLFLIPAQPWWSIIVITLDVLIIYAVTVHGRDFRAPSSERLPTHVM
jgi:hypothetical protein